MILVLVMIRSADLVPVVIINAVVVGMILVMQIMVSGCIQMLQNRMSQKILVPELKVGVSPHVDVKHKAVKQEHPMSRYRE